MSKAEQAISCFEGAYSCSQSVFVTFAEELGVDPDIALKIAGGFGGGMGSMGEVCGALSGAFMAIGLHYSAGKEETGETKARTYKIIQESADRFRTKNGHIRCRDLLGIDISTPEGHDLAAQKGLFTTHCRKYVKDAADIVEDILH